MLLVVDIKSKPEDNSVCSNLHVAGEKRNALRKGLNLETVGACLNSLGEGNLEVKMVLYIFFLAQGNSLAEYASDKNCWRAVVLDFYTARCNILIQARYCFGVDKAGVMGRRCPFVEIRINIGTRAWCT